MKEVNIRFKFNNHRDIERVEKACCVRRAVVNALESIPEDTTDDLDSVDVRTDDQLDMQLILSLGENDESKDTIG